MTRAALVQAWSSLARTTRIATILTVGGLAALAIGWIVRSALIALVGAVLWTPAICVLAADLAARGVGR